MLKSIATDSDSLELSSGFFDSALDDFDDEAFTTSLVGSSCFFLLGSVQACKGSSSRMALAAVDVDGSGDRGVTTGIRSSSSELLSVDSESDTVSL